MITTQGTIDLQTIVNVWLEALQASEVILNYCKEKYGKAPAYLAGASPRQGPGESYCPYILLLPGDKQEGAGIDVNTYSIGVAWVISNADVIVDGVQKPYDDYPDAALIRSAGMEEANRLGQLIYETLQECAIGRGYPITKIDYNVSGVPGAFPQFAGTMVATTEIMPCMGEELSY